MANAKAPRLFYNDLADARLGATILAVSGTIDPDYPAANLINRDRYATTRWTVNPVDVDIALPATSDVYAIGFANHFPNTGSTLISGGCTIFGSGSPSFTSPTTLLTLSSANWIGTITAAQPKDVAAGFTNGVANFRYFRIRFTGWSNPFSLGRLLLFGGFYDGQDTAGGGHGYSAGSSFQIISPRNRGRSLGGQPIFEDIGRTRMAFSMRYRVQDDALRGIAEQIALQRRPYMITDHDGQAFHVESGEDDTKFEHLWGTPNLWDLQVEAEQLP